MRNIKLARGPFALAVPAVGAVILLANPGAGHASQATAQQQSVTAGAPQSVTAAVPQSAIASSTAHDLRIVVSAVRTGSGSAPSATVYVTAYDKSGGVWRKLDEMRLGARNQFFWDTITDSHAVRDFTISNTDPRGGSIRLLESPALGFSPTFHFQLVHGKLVS